MGACKDRGWEHAGVRMRSSWERDFTRFLDTLGGRRRWRYEPKRFRLPDGRSYTPDFFVRIPGRGIVIVEVKGYWGKSTVRGIAKFDAFVAAYGLPAVMLTHEHIEAIRRLLNEE